MEETKAGASGNRRSATSASDEEWKKSPSAAVLLWVPLHEFAQKFAAENRDGGPIAKEQARLLGNLADQVKKFTEATTGQAA